jgi:hypothetical protein
MILDDHPDGKPKADPAEKYGKTQEDPSRNQKGYRPVVVAVPHNPANRGKAKASGEGADGCCV